MRRAIARFALGTLILGVSCTPAPISTNSSSPSPHIKQSISPSPPLPISSPIAIPSVLTQPLTATVPTVIPQTQLPSTLASFPSVEQEIDTPSFVPIIGNADKIAFINQGEIWMSNLDGSALTQLTSDNLPKSSLQWSPDNNGVIYLVDLCANYVNIQSLQIREIVCFDQAERLESFQISPDGEQVAISLDGRLYVVPFDEAGIRQVRSSADLVKIAGCEHLAPYKHRQSMVTISKAHWSADVRRLAILRQAYEADRQVELIQILDVTRCENPLPRLDEFPATRFEMEDYARNPIIQDFAWDGVDLFALTSYQRNDGFGDLWIYNSSLHRGFKANPIEGKCCYRDPVFSPDGKYLAFIFQDAHLAQDSSALLYYFPYAALDSSLVYPPIQLPQEFFSDRRVKPQPILRPAR